MSQHDFNIANQGFPATRADINNAFQAIASNSSGATAPSTTYANMWWYDTTNNKMYLRNEADSAWIEVATIDQTNNEWQITTGVVQAKDSDGLALKTDDGNTRIEIQDDGDVAFDTDTLFVDAVNDRVGIGTNAPSNKAAIVFDNSGTTQSSFDGLVVSNSNSTTNNGSAISFAYGANGNSFSKIGVINTDRSGGSEDQSIFFGTLNGGSYGERARIDADGLKFNGDTAAANALDDYEEGTWSPTIKGSTSAGTGTYSIQEGYYRKVGQLIFVSAYMTWTAHTGTGNFVFVLPFAPNLTGFKYSSITIGYISNVNWGASNTSPNVHVAPNVAEAYLGYSTNNAAWVQSSLDTAGSIIISGCYSTA